MKAAAVIQVDVDGKGRRSLRAVLYDFLRRSVDGYVVVLWREEQLSSVAGYPLRRYSGVKAVEDWDFLPDEHKERLNRLSAEGMSPWRCSCSPFAFAKVVKHVVRAALAVIDIDQSISHWRAVHDRHPTSQLVAGFVADPESYFSAGCSRGAGKALYVGLISGGGQKFLEEWTNTHKVAVPRHALLMQAEMSRLRTIDCQNNQQLLQALQALRGPRAPLTLQTILNEKFERSEQDKVNQQVEGHGGLATVVSFEHDGSVPHSSIPQSPQEIADWKSQVLQVARAAVATVVAKEYPTKEQLLQQLSETKPGEDEDWETLYEYGLELTRRLGSDRTMPDVLVSALVAQEIYREPNLRICDVFKLVPSMEQANARVAVMSPHGTWDFLAIHLAAARLKDIVLKVVRDHMPAWWEGDLPGWVRKGKIMQSAAVQVLTDHCYDHEFFANLDSEVCRKFFMFGDGRAIDGDTFELLSQSQLPKVPLKTSL